MTKRLRSKHLLGLEDLTPAEIELVLDTARPFRDLFTRSVRKVPTLRGRSVVLLFYENSTRTRTSFDLAAKRLSADTVNIAVATSSVQKGESLLDTAFTMEAMKADFIVIRHAHSGAPHLLARSVNASIINAGDGFHEHPTQGLLDLYTIRERKGDLKNLKVVIVGDILHSRVARSNLWGLTKLGASVILCGPPTLIPTDIASICPRRIDVVHNLDEAIRNADVVNILRVQFERQLEHLFPSIREYSLLYGMNRERLARAKDDVLILHPGPMNRGIEITSDVADSVNSVINEQVTNGIAVRMAVLYLLSLNQDPVPAEET
jgi:aspartate carbamoyltransferase catalytic subunit